MGRTGQMAKQAPRPKLGTGRYDKRAEAAPNPAPTAAVVASTGVQASEREGVFVHSFKCLGCGLGFMIFSWQSERHRIGRVACPECANCCSFVHWRANVNERQDSETNGTEIDDLFPYPGSNLVQNSRISDGQDDGESPT